MGCCSSKYQQIPQMTWQALSAGLVHTQIYIDRLVFDFASSVASWNGCLLFTPFLCVSLHGQLTLAVFVMSQASHCIKVIQGHSILCASAVKKHRTPQSGGIRGACTLRNLLLRNLLNCCSEITRACHHGAHFSFSFKILKFRSVLPVVSDSLYGVLYLASLSITNSRKLFLKSFPSDYGLDGLWPYGSS